MGGNWLSTQEKAESCVSAEKMLVPVWKAGELEAQSAPLKSRRPKVYFLENMKERNCGLRDQAQLKEGLLYRK